MSVRSVADGCVHCCIAMVRLHVTRATWDRLRANHPKCTLSCVFLCITQRMAKVCMHETKQEDVQVHIPTNESSGEVTHATIRIVTLCLPFALALRLGHPCACKNAFGFTLPCHNYGIRKCKAKAYSGSLEREMHLSNEANVAFRKMETLHAFVHTFSNPHPTFVREE